MKTLTQQQIIDLFKDLPSSKTVVVTCNNNPDLLHAAYDGGCVDECYMGTDGFRFGNGDWYGGKRYLAIPRPVAAPTYTQSMADASTFPSVGMEYLCEDGQLNRCLVIEQDKIIGLMIEHVPVSGVLPISQSSLCDIKPLTPPIELIDGECYEFLYMAEDKAIGIYSSTLMSFDNYGRKFKSAGCTYIQLLEVTK